MTRFKNADAKIQEMQKNGKNQEIEMAKFSRNTVGRDHEIQMPKFNKSLWQGSRNTTAELPLCLPA
jgi:hypothetical protein